MNVPEYFKFFDNFGTVINSVMWCAVSEEWSTGKKSDKKL